MDEISEESRKLLSQGGANYPDAAGVGAHIEVVVKLKKLKELEMTKQIKYVIAGEPQQNEERFVFVQTSRCGLGVDVHVSAGRGDSVPVVRFRMDQGALAMVLLIQESIPLEKVDLIHQTIHHPDFCNAAVIASDMLEPVEEKP